MKKQTKNTNPTFLLSIYFLKEAGKFCATLDVLREYAGFGIIKSDKLVTTVKCCESKNNFKLLFKINYLIFPTKISLTTILHRVLLNTT